MNLVRSFLNAMFFVLLFCSCIKLLSIAKIMQTRETYQMPSEYIDKVEAGEDPEQLANDACETSDREKIALDKVDVEEDILPEVDADVQAEEISEAEEKFYGMARHARSGNLLQVNLESGSKISDDNGWVSRTSEGGKLAIAKEDLESSDDAFSRNYALWKCYKNASCKGTIYSRDGSSFALYSSFDGPTVALSDPGIPGKKGKGQFITKKGNKTTTLDLQPKTNKNADDEADGGDYDLHILDSPERVAAEKEAEYMKEATSKWRNNLYGDAEGAIHEAKTNCQLPEYNPATDWSRFSCVVTGCAKKKKNNNNKHQCTARPKSLL